MSARAVASGPQRYSVVAMVLHWLTAAVLFLQLGLGWRMHNSDWPLRATLLGWHRSIGVSILLLTTLRLAWRWAHAPPESNELTSLERVLSRWVHRGFYALLIVLPLTGWLVTSVEGPAGGTRLFGTIPWPRLPSIGLLPANAQEAVAFASGSAHTVLAWTIVVLLALHIAGAMKHLFLSQDSVAGRMLPGAATTPLNARVFALPLIAALACGLAFAVGPAPSAPPRPAVTQLASADVFLDVVQPVLSRRCITCHNDDRSKGGLSLANHAAVMAGGLHGPVVIAGDAAGSELIRRITLDPSHRNFMPAEGRAPVSPAQVQALTWWVYIGAPATGAVAGFKASESSAVAVAQVLHLASGDGEATDHENLPVVAMGDPAAISALTAAGFNIRPVAANSHLLDVNRYRHTPVTAEDVANLARLRDQIRTLAVRGSSISDAHLEVVGQMAHLTLLKLDDNPVTDAGLKQLGNLQQLQSLSLTGTRVSSAGATSLAGLRNLQRLYVWNTSVGREKAVAIRTANPRLQLVSEVE